jgi:hypothetical protein
METDMKQLEKIVDGMKTVRAFLRGISGHKYYGDNAQEYVKELTAMIDQLEAMARTTVIVEAPKPKPEPAPVSKPAPAPEPVRSKSLEFPNDCKRWSKKEEKTLSSLVEKHTDINQMSSILGRTCMSVTIRAKQLGLVTKERPANAPAPKSIATKPTEKTESNPFKPKEKVRISMLGLQRQELVSPSVEDVLVNQLEAYGKKAITTARVAELTHKPEAMVQEILDEMVRNRKAFNIDGTDKYILHRNFVEAYHPHLLNKLNPYKGEVPQW